MQSTRGGSPTLAWSYNASPLVIVAFYIAKKLRERIKIDDNGRCAYCRTAEANSGLPLTHDHIQPRAKGGRTNFENVCQACRSCNEYKSDSTEALDPLTGETVPLFNPRHQRWSEHFSWSVDSTQINGLTMIGRATVIALKMNNATIVPARRRWAAAGWHPPKEE